MKNTFSMRTVLAEPVASLAQLTEAEQSLLEKMALNPYLFAWGAGDREHETKVYVITGLGAPERGIAVEVQVTA